MSSVATPRKHTASKADVALRNLSDDLSYLSTPHTSDEVLPPHIRDVVSDFAHEMPKTNPFMAAVLSVRRPNLPMFTNGGTSVMAPVDFAQLTVHEAVKKDALQMLNFLHKELGGTPELERKIEGLNSLGSEHFNTEVAAVVSGLQRHVIDSAHTAVAAMRKQAQAGLWSRTESTEVELSQHFAAAEADLARAVALFDGGHVEEAFALYVGTVQSHHAQLQEIASAANTDFYLKFGAGVGVLIGAGFAAAYTGGASLYATTGSATVTGATGIGALTGSLLVSGATFTAAEKFLNHRIFDIPYFATTDPTEQAMEFTQSSLKMAALMGYMRGYAQVMQLPVYSGFGAKAVTLSANFANEFVGLTSFTAMTDGPSQALEPTAMAHGVATLLGLKVGNAAVLKTGQVTVQKASDLIAAVRQWMPEPAAGFPALMAMPKWALTPQDSADAAVKQSTESGLNVFKSAAKRVSAKLGDLYFGEGQLPAIKKVPQMLISGFNLTASFALANIVRSTLERSSNVLHESAPLLFNKVEKLSPFFSGAEFDKTAYGGIISLIVFLGVGLFVPRIANGSNYLKTIAPEVEVPLHKKVGWYAWEVVTRGVMGAVRLMGDRDHRDVPGLLNARTWLKSAPIDQWVKSHMSSRVGIAVSSALATYPDWILSFVGNVLPSKKAKYGGVAMDISVNTSLSAWNIFSMKGHVDASDISSSLLITILMSIANTHILQHQGFDANQVLSHRTVLGIGKGGANTGFASTAVVSPLNKYGIQLAYGLFSMWYAHKISERNPAIGPITNIRPSADTRATSELTTRHLASVLLSGKPVTIVVVDSGLGGLTVTDNLMTQLQSGPFKEVNIVYYNAVPNWGRGFNHFSEVHRAAALDRVLDRIDRDYKPDMVLLTDHTLATIYPHTERAVSPHQAPVDVVSPGVDMLVAGLNQYPNAKVVIMGSPVTINSGVYQRQLAGRNIPSSRVLTEACPTLSADIEGKLSDAGTEALIHQHAASIAAKVKDLTTPVFVSLNSSQFSFVADRLQAALYEQGLMNARVVDPTLEVTKTLFARLQTLNDGSHSNVTLSVVSQVDLEPVMTGGLGAMLDAQLPRISGPVHHYLTVAAPFDLPPPEETGLPKKN